MPKIVVEAIKKKEPIKKEDFVKAELNWALYGNKKRGRW